LVFAGFFDAAGYSQDINNVNVDEKLRDEAKKNPNFGMRLTKPPFLTMLDFCKEVLTKVSFDRFLFRKELQKAIKWLSGEELVQFRHWCLETFGNRYREIIIASFAAVMMK
jgi:hypothetical protein